MNWWLYKGSVTTPVDIPGQGPTIIQPRMKFQAPPAAVSRLKRIGMVVPCKDPNPSKKEVPVPVPALVVPKKAVPEKKEELNHPKDGSDEVVPVVASTPSNPEPESAPTEESLTEDTGSTEEAAEGEDAGKETKTKEEKGKRKGSKRRRG